jgi:plastocyanin
VRRRICLLSLGLLFALGACGGDDDETEEPAGGRAAPSGDLATVAMKDIKFDPESVTVKVGQTVRWVNEDTVDHDAVAREGARFKSELFGQGESFEWKADKAGTVKYVCTIHPGMEGTIEVQ